MPVLPLHSKELTCPDGIRVFAEAKGDPSKHAIVFIHGLSLTGAAFDKQFNDSRLFENYFLVRYDMRGHGRSGHPFEFKDYESLRYAEELKTVCEGFGIIRPSVVAWSLGGCVVVDIIQAYGASFFSRIIYCGGALLTRQLHNLYIHPHVMSLVPELMSSNADTLAAAGPKYVDSILADKDKIITFSEQLMFQGGFAMQPPTIRGYSLTRTQKQDRWEKEIRDKQVLIIQGTEDRHARADGLVETARKYIGRFDLHLIEGSGHSPNWKRAEEVNGYIVDFLQRTEV